MPNKLQLNRIFLFLMILSLMILGSGCDVKSNNTKSNDITVAKSTEATTENLIEEAHENILIENVDNWSLGNTLIDYVGCNRDYDWFIDQAHTGDYAGSNCGPASVAMAAKWADESFDKTAEDARNEYRSSGGWWYSEDIVACLDTFDVDYDVIEIEDAYTLRQIIDSGRIAIINNSMSYIPQDATVDSRVNRFYTFDSGHYLIVKGYALVDQKTYFEVYDPNNWDMTYADGEPKGKDRFYESTVLMNSITNWHPHVIIINPEN